MAVAHQATNHSGSHSTEADHPNLHHLLLFMIGLPIGATVS